MANIDINPVQNNTKNSNSKKSINSESSEEKVQNSNTESIDAVRQLLFGNQVDHFTNEIVRLNDDLKSEVTRIEEKIKKFNHSIIKKIEDVYKKDVESKFTQFDNSNNERFKGLTIVIDKINTIQDENYKKHSDLIKKNQNDLTHKLIESNNKFTKLIEDNFEHLKKDKVSKEDLSKALINLSKIVLS